MKRTFRFVYQGEEIEVQAERKGETLKIERDGREYTLTLLAGESTTETADTAKTAGRGDGAGSDTPAASVSAAGPADSAGRQGAENSPTAGPSSPGDIPAPMTGVIKECIVSAGDRVKEGEKLMIMEAMKMDIEVSAFSDGTVTKLYVSSADNVQEGQPLLRVE